MIGINVAARSRRGGSTSCSSSSCWERRAASPRGAAGLAIGLALTVVHLFGIPLTENVGHPARKPRTGHVVGGDAIKQ